MRARRRERAVTAANRPAVRRGRGRIRVLNTAVLG